MEPRRLPPPAAAASASAALTPPSPPPPQFHQAPRALPLPSAQAPSKKRRFSPSPRKAATPVPAPSPPPAPATSAPAVASLNPRSLPQAQGDTSTEPAYVVAPTTPPPAAGEKPSTASPPAADEEPSTPPAAARAVLAREPREAEMKAVVIRNRVHKGTFAAGNAAAAVGELLLGGNAAFDEVADEERNARGIEVEELPSGFNAVDVDGALLGSAQHTLLGEEAVGGGTLIGDPVANTDSDACEAEELVSTSIVMEEFGMSDRAERQRRMTELFVCGLNNDMKERDVRSLFGWAGEITEVRMPMDARTSKGKGYCFVRYREPSQAKKLVEEFSKLKICWKFYQIEALDGNDKIVLENIEKKWRKEDIMELLLKTGVEKICTVTLMADCDNPGYNCGYAFLELETERDAWMAYIKLSRKGVLGSPLNITVAWAKPMSDLNITVAWAKPMSDPDEEMQQVKSIFVEGMPHSWDDAKMTEIFSKYGVIQRTVLSRDIQSTKRCDFAFVHYTTHEAAILCLESFHKEEFTENGSKVNIKVSLGKPIRKGKQKKEDKRIINRQKSKTKVAQIELMALKTSKTLSFSSDYLTQIHSHPSQSSIQLCAAKKYSSACQVQEHDDFLQATQGSLLQAQEHVKPYNDIKHTAMAFSVGDWVWVKFLHRPVVSMSSYTKGKLDPRFYGPYQVLERIGDVAYRLQLQAGARINNVFHVGALEPFSGPARATAPLLPPMMLHGNLLPVPALVLRSRLARGQWQVLVRWEGLPESDASWEDVESLQQRYPAIVLEDQLFPREARDVLVGMKYHRRQHV